MGIDVVIVVGFFFLSGIVFCASVLGLCQLKVTPIVCMPLACNWH